MTLDARIPLYMGDDADRLALADAVAPILFYTADTDKLWFLKSSGWVEVI